MITEHSMKKQETQEKKTFEIHSIFKMELICFSRNLLNNATVIVQTGHPRMYSIVSPYLKQHVPTYAALLIFFKAMLLLVWTATQGRILVGWSDLHRSGGEHPHALCLPSKVPGWLIIKNQRKHITVSILNGLTLDLAITKTAVRLMLST